jgi:starch phosphorylase
LRKRAEAAAAAPETTREISALATAIVDRMRYSVGQEQDRAQLHDWFLATAYALRERIVDLWADSSRRNRGRKRVYYLSIEYHIGRLLLETLRNMELVEPVRAALASLDVDLEKLRTIEPDAALGNGGLGRLAACFMESMATLGINAYGYGIRYENGLFEQSFRDGWQDEAPDDWLKGGNPWEIERQGASFPIGFGGSTEFLAGSAAPRAIWRPAEIVTAVAFDTPVVGWHARHVNVLRLWSARAIEPFHFYTFAQGDYVGASAARTRAEAISRVLYPSTDTAAGQELRLRQEYFFTSASLQDLVRRHMEEHRDIATLPQYVTIQMNDTHPAIAVAELMRILVDEHAVDWQPAWSITTAVLNYTNHTLLPEALETWPVALMNHVLPRHMQIIYQINWMHLSEITARSELTKETLAALSLIDESHEQNVRMGHLAFIGSTRVNGVSELHTTLMRESVFHDLDGAYPGRIVNKTNGIGFRRWLHQANPELTELIVDVAGSSVLEDPEGLATLAGYADDKSFAARFAAVRQANKQRLCDIVRERTNIRIDPAALFDVQVKRFHEYKRQLLNVLEAVALFHVIRADPQGNWTPRVKIFAGKAASTYARAKLIIKLVNDVAQVVNNDPVIAGRLKIVFLPNYNVSLAEVIIPASDLSEQISTAGMEASGTGNMKFALNGALTIGTLDGANVEIRDRVGAENIFIFGLHAHEVSARRQQSCRGHDFVHASPLLAEAVESIAAGMFSPDDADRFQPIVESILGEDKFMVAADFDAYWQAQRAVDRLWADKSAWWRAGICNTARMGWFSADRAIREYAGEIWHVPVDDLAATDVRHR